MADRAGVMQNETRELLEVVLLVMRFIRTEMRRHRASDLSVPQFRSLLFINRNPGAALRELAQHLGLTSPSACRLIDALERQELVRRDVSPQDRRRVSLSLTPGGQRILEIARRRTQQSVAVLLAALTAAERRSIERAMPALRRAFAVGRKGK
jgi:DNA-binding MarR family transcriptional regulator